MSVDYAAPVAGDQRTIPAHDGGSIAAVSAGSGPTVVLAHGFGVDRGEWNVVAAQLVESGHRIVAFDQRGHGATKPGSEGISTAAMARDYVTVLEAYDVRDGVLAMHSMGGFVGIRFLIDHADVVRERLRGALLLATFAGDVNRDNPQNKMQIPLIRTGILPFLVRTDVVGKPFARTIMGKKGNDEMGQAFLTMFRAQKLRPARADPAGDGRREPLPAAGQHRPAGRDHGRHRRQDHAAVPHRRAPRGHRRVTLERVQDVGHMVVWEEPETVVATIRRLAGTA